MELKSRLDAELLPFIHKPARFLGNEFHAVHKSLNDVHLRLALCFPEPYDEGMSHLPFELLYQTLNQPPDTWAERCFAPGEEVENRLREVQLPLFSLESKTPLNRFDILVFYVRDVLSVTEILSMLHFGGVPFRRSTHSVHAPLIIGCGPAFGNPEPFAEFFDAFLLPPHEAAGGLMEIISRWHAESRPAATFLERISGIPGVYIPSFFAPQYNRFQEFEGMVANPSRQSDSPPQTPVRSESGRSLTFPPLIPLIESGAPRPGFEEYARPMDAEQCSPTHGAPNRLLPQIYLPSQARLYQLLQQHLRRMEQVSVDFPLAFAPAACDAYWELIRERLLTEEPRIAFTPHRGDVSFRRPASPEIAAEVKQIPFVLSPVSASMRLRTLANVNLRDSDLLDVVQTLLKKGWRTIQLNFVIGLPGEKESDVLAIAELTEKCLKVAQPYSDSSFQILVRTFSPLPHTPFQWEAAPRLATMEQRVSALAERLQNLSVRLIAQPPAVAQLVTILSRGDRKIALAIETAWKNGARLEKVSHQMEVWTQAFGEAQMEPENYLAAISITVPLPWDHLSPGISKSFLKEEKLRAQQGQLHPRNRDFVSFGLGGMKRSDFERFCQSGASPWSNAALQTGSPAVIALTEEPVRYGRKGRKRQTATAIIKQRIRIRYSKTGPMRFLAHPDIVRVIDRSARMAKIPLVYSQGVRKNPKISYGMPLPTGISSIAEYLDMEIEMGREVDLQVRFNEYLPEGIQILQYQGIYSKVAALAAVINRSTYEVLLPSDRDIPESRIAQWLAQPEAIVQRVTKEGEKPVDIRPFVQRLEKHKNKLEVNIDVKEGRGAKITEVLESLLAPLEIDYRALHIQRTGQFIVENGRALTPFEVL